MTADERDDLPDTAGEKELAEQLACFDEGLRTGDKSRALKTAEAQPDDLQRARDCLRLLEAVWPRNPGDAPTLAHWPFATSLVEQEPLKELGRFRIIRELGRGGFGIVYLAYDPQLHRRVALKVPRADVVSSLEIRRRFQQEARAAAGLDHPNL